MADPIEPQHVEIMNKIADVLNVTFTGYGFVLLVFEFGDHKDGRMNYIANAQRDDVVSAMKEFIAMHEGRLLPPSQRKQ